MLFVAPTWTTALANGYLEVGGHVFGIVEVKPYVRDDGACQSLCWQETSPMIAWIMHEKDQGKPKDTSLLLLQGW